MRDTRGLSEDYSVVERVVRLTRRRRNTDIDLTAVSESLHIPPEAIRDAFLNWAGMDVRQLLDALSRPRLEQRIHLSGGVMDLPPGRILEHTPVNFVEVEGVTPEEYRKEGRGMSLVYGLHSTPFGDALIALQGHGICALRFVDKDEDVMLDELQADWPLSHLAEDLRRTGPLMEAVFQPQKHTHLTVLLRGTPFQVGIWSALLRIPPGYLVPYLDVAEYVGNPMAFRVVSETILANPVAYLIPCHRVVRETGLAGGYRWDPQRKKLMIAWESARFSVDMPSLPGG
jgi:AraC family transcriptional regulator of adaptative response/methylated-DNA-[protein]-cysteine methyltransferase